MDKQELIIQGERKKDVYLLRLQGDITKPSGEELLRWVDWEKGLPDQLPRLVLDLSSVPYINSAGIAYLIRLVRLGQEGGFETSCFGVSYHYEKLFQMVGLTRWLTICPSEWAAMGE